MNINLKIKYSALPDYHWLCFTCAAKLASQGVTVDTDIDDYDSDYYMGTTICDGFCK